MWDMLNGGLWKLKLRGKLEDKRYYRWRLLISEDGWMVKLGDNHRSRYAFLTKKFAKNLHKTICLRILLSQLQVEWAKKGLKLTSLLPPTQVQGSQPLNVTEIWTSLID